MNETDKTDGGRVEADFTVGYSWRDGNRLKKFSSWAEEIAHMESLGYKLVPPQYRIPHWSVKMQAGEQVPKLYVLRNDGPDELSASFDCYAANLGYPVFFRPGECCASAILEAVTCLSPDADQNYVPREEVEKLQAQRDTLKQISENNSATIGELRSSLTAAATRIAELEQIVENHKAQNLGYVKHVGGENGQLKARVTQLRTAMEEIRDGKLAVPFLRPELYGHASAIALSALLKDDEQALTPPSEQKDSA